MSTPGSIGSASAQPSSASLTRRSASALCSRRTWRIDQRSKSPQGLLHLGVQLAHRRVLDLVLALDLAHDQLRVADQLQLAGAQRRRPLDPEQQRPVLGDVVGRPADPLAALLEHLAVRRPGPRRRSPPGPGLPRAPPSTLTTSFTRRLSQPARRRGSAAARRRAPRTSCRPRRRSRSTAGPSRRAARSRRPCRARKTGRSSSPRSTPHWYQESSQATVIRTSLGEPAAAPTETQGCPGCASARRRCARPRWR